MRNATAYFAGVGTVIVAIAAGLGGGLLISNIVSPQSEKHGSTEMTRLERRMSPEPLPATTGPLEPVPYLAAPQISAAVAEPPAQPAAQQSQPQTAPQQASIQSAAPAQAAPPPPAAQGVAGAEQPAAREKAASEDSFTRARDADLKRDARRAEDRRKAERRQQWTERRKWRQRDDDELGDVERKVREETEPREAFSTERVRMEMPRIRLFDHE